jgi:hypothetical protein
MYKPPIPITRLYACVVKNGGCAPTLAKVAEKELAKCLDTPFHSSPSRREPKARALEAP